MHAACVKGCTAWPVPQVKHGTPEERALLRTLVLKARDVNMQVCSAALTLLAQACAPCLPCLQAFRNAWLLGVSEAVTRQLLVKLSLHPLLMSFFVAALPLHTEYPSSCM